MINHKQHGFTLLELMVGLVLGLLIVAAGLSVFLSGQRSIALQDGMGELQQNANFGLAMMTHDLRHANLNSPSTQKVNNKQVGSGIIFEDANLPSSLAGKVTGLLTKQDADNDATTGKSDQLTIQFVPQYTKITKKVCPAGNPTCTAAQKVDEVSYVFNGIDCEGNSLTFSTPQTIVQRYHLKPDPVQTAGQPTAYSLYCDAGYYKDGDTSITGMNVDNNGQQLMQRIDAFKIRLSVKDKDKKLRYMTLDQYIGAMPSTVIKESDYSNVISVEIGLLARSTSSQSSESLIDNTKVFKIFGNDISLNNTQKNGTKFLREVFSQVVAFRNTLGAS
ncbi:PilW family protein [Acinetobacter sp. VNH17]|uniref:PilW family protein n=1 Tax=Acinetobacter thutiue TaxID=2998078 RepID=A0ABT7WP75_9GAMM|nr:PilW family protein [Acinetobacter thutiue]MCY6412392.1 PilW family protein [Acinetobacter thutiue]MDN0014496.1 PilW family protein [Acinetobacter thutiue]